MRSGRPTCSEYTHAIAAPPLSGAGGTRRLQARQLAATRMNEQARRCGPTMFDDHAWFAPFVET
jgi:hypothetical protein